MPTSRRRVERRASFGRTRVRRVGGSSRTGKVRKAFWLDPRLLAEARATLGASTEREAVEMALDLVRFRSELARGARTLRGLGLSRLD